MTVALRRSWAKDLDARTLYELLKLRVEVFVVEQATPYPELDGRVQGRCFGDHRVAGRRRQHLPSRNQSGKASGLAAGAPAGLLPARR